MKVLLTGGTGFIGSYVLMQLVKEGHDVTVLARNAQKVPAFTSMKNVDVLEVPMTDFEGTKQALQGKDACIHVALNYNDNSGYDMLMNDTAPSVFLASEAAKAGVKHFIYTSSTAALDNIYSLPDPFVNSAAQDVISAHTKQDPQSYYGATKAAVENFLLAIGSQTDMRVNIIRPGYTFGNPVVEGAYTQPDSRFKDIVQAAVSGEKLELVKNDGTQFLWGGDIAKIYTAVLNGNMQKKVYFGLSNQFTSWEFIAREAIKQSKSSSELIITDLGWSEKPILFDVSDIKKDFGFSFSPHPHIEEHVAYYVNLLT